jgi:hypothetical protein
LTSRGLGRSSSNFNKVAYSRIPACGPSAGETSASDARLTKSLVAVVAALADGRTSLPPNVTRARRPTENPERIHAGDRKNKRPFIVNRECMAGPVMVSWENLQRICSSDVQSGENLLVPRARAPGTLAMVQRIFSSGDVHCHPLVGRGRIFWARRGAEAAEVHTVCAPCERRPSELVGSGSEASRSGSGDQVAWNRASGRTGERGGARVGKPRWVRILAITAGSSMAAMSFKAPPQFGQR